ncbi:MAG: hypothetical protein H7338_10075 [Candidatus Sericytochromatia bacterium]|nr:hypothetical protein [Candidatus Sericytochromatia bacterium]
MSRLLLALLTALTFSLTSAVPALALGPLHVAATGQTEWLVHPTTQATIGEPAGGPFPVGRLIQGLLGLTGTVIFAFAGAQMTGLKSVSGTSVAESYYQSMGVFSFGLAALTGMLALQAALPPEKP